MPGELRMLPLLKMNSRSTFRVRSRAVGALVATRAKLASTRGCVMYKDCVGCRSAMSDIE